MPESELCSFCFVERMRMMQQSAYSSYDSYFQSDLEVINAKCGLSHPTEMPPLLDIPGEVDPDPICVSGNTYTTVAGDTCDSIALHFNVSSAALFMANPRHSVACANVPVDIELCLPLPCQTTYLLRDTDTCVSIEMANKYRLGDVRKYNTWVSWDCTNLQSSIEVYGRVLCMGAQGGSHTATAPIPGVTLNPGGSGTGYVGGQVAPSADAAGVAPGTTLRCGKWHIAAAGETCAAICTLGPLTSGLFLEVNPSLEPGTACSSSLMPGNAYCIGPNWGWDRPLPEVPVFPDDEIISSAEVTATAVP